MNNSLLEVDSSLFAKLLLERLCCSVVPHFSEGKLHFDKCVEQVYVADIFIIKKKNFIFISLTAYG